MTYKELLPKEFLLASEKLDPRTATPHEYLELCKLAVRLIDEGETTTEQRSEMSYVLACFTGPERLNNRLERIRGAFLEFEVPRGLDFKDGLNREEWQRVRDYILTVDESDTREPLSLHEKHVPADFSKLTHSLLANSRPKQQDFVKLCQMATKLFDKRKHDQVMQSNLAYHITDVWYRRPALHKIEGIGSIVGQFSKWEKPGSFNMEYIVDGHQWETLKQRISELGTKWNIDERR